MQGRERPVFVVEDSAGALFVAPRLADEDSWVDRARALNDDPPLRRQEFDCLIIDGPTEAIAQAEGLVRTADAVVRIERGGLLALLPSQLLDRLTPPGPNVTRVVNLAA